MRRFSKYATTFCRSTSGSWRWLGISLLVTAGSLLLGGCESRVSDAPATEMPLGDVVSAASWDDQIAGVRSSRSFSVCVPDTELNVEQVQELNEVASQLRVLEIRVDQDSVAAIPWEAFTQLRQLVLHGPVSNEVLKRIAELPKLEILNLPHGSFSDSGVAQLADHSQLQLFRFHSPNVTDACLQSVAEMASLRFLHILDSPVSDAGLVALHEMHQLESFYLDGSKCTDDGLSELLKALPELHFHWNETHLDSDVNKHPH